MAGDSVSQVLVEERGEGVVLVTLNRPEALNALGVELLEALQAAFSGLGEETRAVVLTGAGRAFCTGADLKARASMDVAQWRAHHETLRDAFAEVRGCPYPTIAAVEGFALAGGLELALCCDVIMAAEDAQLGLPEVTRGIMPGAGGTKVLPALVGAGRAKELIFTGRRFSAVEGEAWGIVARTAPAGAAVEAALELARKVADNAPLAVRAAKRSIDGEDELEAYWTCVPSQDQAEGIRAFVEKREPRFSGR